MAELPAELLETRGELDRALTWFDLIISSFTRQGLEAARGERGWMTEAGRFLRSRRRVRDQLGLTHDELDRVLPSEQEILSTPLLPGVLPPKDTCEDSPAAPAGPRTLRILYWPRAEHAAAVARWPELLESEKTDPEYYFPYLQRKWTRAVEEQGVTRVELVPATGETMAAYAERTGTDVTDEDTRKGYTAERHAAGHVVPYPPERNAPCWCDSGRKYKKCCGHPSRQ